MVVEIARLANNYLGYSLGLTSRLRTSRKPALNAKSAKFACQQGIELTRVYLRRSKAINEGSMKKSTRAFLEEVTSDELLSCIQLLAISVVQHRAKCGFVALQQSSEELPSGTEEAAETGLFSQGKEVVDEALELVRTLAAQHDAATAADSESDESGPESRTQLRINIATSIKVLWPQHSRPVDAKLENISWGGASVQVDEVKTDSGDSLRIILPRPQGGSISIEAKILRSRQHRSGNGYDMALRFSSLSTRDETKLEGILEHLAQSADDGGQRDSARLTQRLDIQFDGVQELRSTLDDISAGGLGITVPDPLQIGQSLQTVISALDTDCALKLRARVVRQEQRRMGYSKVYKVGLKFEHPTEELQKRTNELIRALSSIKNDQPG